MTTTGTPSPPPTWTEYFACASPGTIAVTGFAVAALVVALIARRCTRRRRSEKTPGATHVADGVLALHAKRIAEQSKASETAQEALRTATAELAKLEAQVTEAQPPSSALQQQIDAAEQHVRLATQVADYERQQLNTLMGGGAPCRDLGSYVQYGIFFVLALVVLVFLMWGITTNALLSSLASINTARGLITFLVAVVTGAIALILVLATVVSESADREVRFRAGKEILVSLIGVLGTIVGYYFGQNGEHVRPPTILAPFVSKSTITSGEEFSIAGFVSGGKPPYVYSIEFDPKVVSTLEKQRSANGQLTGTLQANDVKEATDVTFEIRARDDDGVEARFDSRAAGQKLHVEPKANATGREAPKK